MNEVLELVETPPPVTLKKMPRPGRHGNIPPVEFQFKPGQTGNPGGRPKIITEACKKVLAEPAVVEEFFLNEKGKVCSRKRVGTRAEAIAARMAHEASKSYSMGTANAQLGAFESLRRVVEPTEAEAGGLDHSIKIAMTVVKEIAIQCATHGKPDDE